MGISTQLDCRRDWGAYVLGGLDREETLACRRHLARCASCREEIEMLVSAADALPLMVAQTQQLAIVPARTVRDVRRDGIDRLATRAARSGTRQTPPKGRFLKRILAKPVPTPALAGIAALLVAAGITLVLSFHSADTRLVRGQANWRTGGIVVQLSGSRGELLVDGMPPAPAGATYEAWLRHGHGVLVPSGATFDVDGAGEAAVRLPGRLGAGDTVVVAPRMLGGTKAVREPIVASAHL